MSRRMIRKTRFKELVADAKRARRFTTSQRMEMGLALIKFGLEFREAARHARHV